MNNSDKPIIQGLISSNEEWLRNNRFTDHARKIVNHLPQRIADLGINSILPPTVLLSTMLIWKEKIGVHMLEKCGVNLDSLENDVKKELENIIQTRKQNDIDFIRINEVLLLACEQAKVLGHNYVGSEHLVLALCKTRDDTLERLFNKHSISSENYTKQLLKMLKG